MQKLLLAIVAIAVVAGGAYWLSQNSSQTETGNEQAVSPTTTPISAPTLTPTPSPVGPAVTISYTNAGFGPSTVTIKKGQTVRFKNDSTTEVWPASAVHPTHSVYPQKSASDCLGSSFDACRGLKAGEFWDFTFNEVGEWAFHDHLHASKFGKVVVTQ